VLRFDRVFGSTSAPRTDGDAKEGFGFMTDEILASGAPRSAIWRRLEDIRLWLQKQADECRQSAEQIERRVQTGRAFNGDENVAAHNRKNQQFFQTKADTITEAQDAALRACPEAPPPIQVPDVPAPAAELCWTQSRAMVRCDRKAGHGGRHSWERAEALAPSPQKGHALIDLWRQRAKDDMKYGASKARVTGNDLKGAAREYYGTVNAAFAVAECADELEAALSPTTIRAHVLGCPKNFSVPVDLCECGGRDFLPSALRAEALAPPNLAPQSTDDPDPSMRGSSRLVPNGQDSGHYHSGSNQAETPGGVDVPTAMFAAGRAEALAPPDPIVCSQCDQPIPDHGDIVCVDCYKTAQAFRASVTGNPPKVCTTCGHWTQSAACHCLPPRAEALAPPEPTLDDYGELDRRLTLLPRVKHDGLDYVNLASVLLLTRAKLYSPPRADAREATRSEQEEKNENASRVDGVPGVGHGDLPR
jgi:hypothetical protein